MQACHEYSALLKALFEKRLIISRRASFIYPFGFRSNDGDRKMKTMIVALGLLSLAGGPVFAASPVFGAGSYVPQSGYVPGYYGVNPNSPALTGGGSIGHNRLQQAF
jgi:hypothetical protein